MKGGAFHQKSSVWGRLEGASPNLLAAAVYAQMRQSRRSVSWVWMLFFPIYLS